MSRMNCPKCSNHYSTGFVVYEADITYCLNCGYIIEDRCETPPDVRYNQEYNPGESRLSERRELVGTSSL